MADPLRHESKLDIADEIMNFIANNPEAREIRQKIREKLDITNIDMEDAAEIITDFRNLMKNQEF